MFRALLDDVPPGAERADVLFGIVQTEQPDTQAMVDLCGEALAEAAGDDARSARILSFCSGARVRTGEGLDRALDEAREALRRAERAGEPALAVSAIGRIGIAAAWVGEDIHGLLERGVETEARLGLEPAYYDSPRYSLSRRLACLGKTDESRAVLEGLYREAVAKGDEASRGQLVWWLSLLEWSVGRLQQALDHATVAHDLARQTQYSHARVWVGRAKTLVEVDLGLVEDARASAEEAIAAADETSSGLFGFFGVAALGRLELALGRYERAASRLCELPGQLLARGVRDPMLAVWADAIETLVAVGELERAAILLDTYEADAQRLTCPWATAAAARCRGLLAGGNHDFGAAFAAFQAALAVLETHHYPLERGRTLLCLGAVRRRAHEKRAAREALAGALAIFEELGAPLWAQRARAELARISGRGPASDELTETERRVAELAVRGRSNKEIAAELFMGVSTVEAHLSRAYRKLGIRSRTQLAVALAIPGGGAVEVEGETVQA